METCFFLWAHPRSPVTLLVTTLVLNMDNGPENHSRRTQFIKRLIDFVAAQQVTVQLAYYPPYHSKYHPIEHCWGALEQHWNGSLLDELDTVQKFAESMTWRKKHPVVSLVTTVYKTGVCLSQAAMADLEAKMKRLPNLEKWFVEISPATLTLDT